MPKMISLKQCVEFAVNTEAELSEYYEHLAEQCSEDPEISDLFSTLSKDEEQHKRQFQTLLKKASKSKVALSTEQNDFLMAMSLSKTFAQLYGRKTFVYSKSDKEKLLFELFEFEKATLGFYSALAEIMGKDKVLKEIVVIEKKHVVAVMKMIITGSKFVSLHDSWP